MTWHLPNVDRRVVLELEIDTENPEFIPLSAVETGQYDFLFEDILLQVILTNWEG